METLLCEPCINWRKVVMIGCGFVGSATVFSLMQSSLFSEIVLIDADDDKAEGEAMDISHGVPLVHHMKIYAGDYDDIRDAAVVVITAGAAQKPGETRLDLIHKNTAIFEKIIPEIKRRDFGGILLIVSNPVDVLTYTAARLSGLPAGRVIGSGTVLDTARLKYRLSEELAVDSRSIHAFIIGEHGDSEIAAWSSANVSGVPLHLFCGLRGIEDYPAFTRKVAEQVKNSAYEIIERKRATYYGVAMAVRRILEAVIRDEKSILPVSSVMSGEYGIEGVALSMPSVVGKDGVECRIPISLSGMEQEALIRSANLLRSYIGETAAVTC